MKVFRPLGGNIFEAIGHDGPHALIPNALQTFNTDIPVQPKDVIGLSSPAGAGSQVSCTFGSPGENGTRFASSDLQDGQPGSFTEVDNQRVDVMAVVASKTSGDFSFGKVKKNKGNGTATVAVDVPGPGTLSLIGSGVKTQRSGGATVSKDVAAAGTYKLKVKAKGAKKKKLRDRGKVKVKVKVTFKPAATGGDVAGDPNTEPKKIKLIDK